MPRTIKNNFAGTKELAINLIGPLPLRPLIIFGAVGVAEHQGALFTPSDKVFRVAIGLPKEIGWM